MARRRTAAGIAWNVLHARSDVYGTLVFATSKNSTNPKKPPPREGKRLGNQRGGGLDARATTQGVGTSEIVLRIREAI